MKDNIKIDRHKEVVRCGLNLFDLGYGPLAVCLYLISEINSLTTILNIDEKSCTVNIRTSSSCSIRQLNPS
jgi:hypothetical protein